MIKKYKNKTLSILLNWFFNFGGKDMKTKENQIVMPGDKIGIIEQYLPGEGTYDDNGDIKSTVLGNVKINQKNKIISVETNTKPSILKVGDTIYGQITDIKSQRATVNIECIKDNTRPLALPYIGAIHISKVKKKYIEKLTDAFRIGDIIQAKVIKISGDNVDLSTTTKKCGVLKAMCTRCRDYMHETQKKYELECNTCKKREKRKISANYINE